MKRGRGDEAEEADGPGDEVAPSSASKRHRAAGGDAADPEVKHEQEDGAEASGGGRGDGDGDAGSDLDRRASGSAAGPKVEATSGDYDDDDDDEGGDHIRLPKSSSRAAVRKGQECPYLDTISRQVRHHYRFAPTRLPRAVLWCAHFAGARLVGWSTR